MSDKQSDYQELSRLAESAGLDYNLAEMHGIACGLLCGMADNITTLWQDALFAEQDVNDVLVSEARVALDELLDYTRAQFNDNELSLSLMLPADDEPIALRVAAVRDWSLGFLYGFGLSGKQAGNLFSSDAGEALKDLVEISRMDTEQLEDAEQDEEALNQLTEYLWVAALLIRHDMISNTSNTKPAE